jgi:hypothetical protein
MFTYIVRDSPSFVLTSLVVLLIIVVADVAMARVGPVRQLLDDGSS